jgi:hypothetical protein
MGTDAGRTPEEIAYDEAYVKSMVPRPMQAGKTLEELIDEVPPGYGWLIRSDASGRFLANITWPDFVNDGDRNGEGGKCSPVYGRTPHEALEGSIKHAKAASGLV